MDCQVSDAKKMLTTCESSLRRKHSGRRREELDRHSAPSETSIRCSNIGRKSVSAMNSVHEIEVISEPKKKDRESSLENVAGEGRHRSHRSPRRHRKESFALKRGGGGPVESTPRSNSPRKNSNTNAEEHDSSFIYECLEEELKNDKKKHRHSKREHQPRECRRARDGSRRDDEGDRRRHRHRRRDEPELYDTSPEDRRPPPESAPVDQSAILGAFAQLCAQMTQQAQAQAAKPTPELHRSLSHKSLQCEAGVKPERLDARPSRLETREYYREPPAARYNSQTCLRGYEEPYYRDRERERPYSNYPRDSHDALKASESEIGRYREYPLQETRTKCYIDTPALRYRERPEYSDCPSRERRERYEGDKRRCEQKTSRSFELHRDREAYEEDRLRKTSRSEEVRDKIYEEPRDVYYGTRSKRDLNERYYDDRRERYQSMPRERCKSRRAVDARCDRSLIEDVTSDRERDSMVSPIEEDKSVVSEPSNNCYRAVKQEISEQRESIDKMMKLWKEMMRSFKVLSQNPTQNSKLIEEKTSDFRDSAEAQLQLWRECMRRYETVARDVGDTDARLMDEIAKQRGEIAEMSAMWQECLQRYKEISKDFNTLKKQVQSTESASHQTVCAAAVAADGEGPPAAHYRVPPHHYLPPPLACRAPLPPYHASDATLRAAPPPWGWYPREREAREPSRRRQSSPESRAGSRDRCRRRKERDDSRYKEKSSKPSGTRMEHRHRKR